MIRGKFIIIIVKQYSHFFFAKIKSIERWKFDHEIRKSESEINGSLEGDFRVCADPPLAFGANLSPPFLFRFIARDPCFVLILLNYSDKG